MSQGLFLSLFLATIALLVSLGACFIALNRSPSIVHLRGYLGDSYIMLEDASGELVGTIGRSYGDEIMVRRIERSGMGERGSQLLLGKEGVSIQLVRDEKPIAVWSLSEDGEKFERPVGASKP
jgi:hypothetical protein